MRARRAAVQAVVAAMMVVAMAGASGLTVVHSLALIA
jgi:hypothetical protein